jgi:Uma2 family endonuclease
MVDRGVAMSTANPPKQPVVAPLVEGQRLDQPTFHARYEAIPSGTRAELIGGVVSMPGATGHDHGASMVPLIVWVDYYAEHTPGVDPLAHTTVILNKRNEPQPDLMLRILPERRGRTRDEEGYVVGTPELVIEVAQSSRYVDLGPKLNEYERAGVLEYIVCSVDPEEILWHVLERERFVVVAPDADGLYRSRTFPGLWLDPQALLARDTRALRAVIDRGVATPEHAAVVARLAAARGMP